MRHSGLPSNVTEFRDRHGKWRLRFRAKGRPTYYFKARPGTEEFRAELDVCRAGSATAPGASSRHVEAGTMGALISLYYGTSAFTGLAASSKKTYRSTLERFKAAHGSKRVAALERRHIKAIIGAMAATPAAANKLLDKLKLLMTLAVDEGWRKDDPTLGVRGFSQKTEGFHTWSEDEIRAYEQRHPIGSTARRALALMLFTGQHRSDAAKMGQQHPRRGAHQGPPAEDWGTALDTAASRSGGDSVAASTRQVHLHRHRARATVLGRRLRQRDARLVRPGRPPAVLCPWSA